MRELKTVLSVNYRERLKLRPFSIDEIRIILNAQTTTVRNYHEAIACLKAQRYDMVFFDHDLGEDTLSGMDVAKWVAQNIKLPFLFYVHSANPVGRENIQSYLTQFFQTLQEKNNGEANRN